jgi:hypothetical protein
LVAFTGAVARAAVRAAACGDIRAVFVVIMSSDDYLDALQKLLALGLRDKQACHLQYSPAAPP